MGERRDKSNKRFMILSAIGIFMVVDHHTFTAFNLFGDVIPYNSFFMPMFVFISGYFNKVNNSTNLWTYFIKKVKTLLIPYIGLSLTVFTLQQLINYIKLGNEVAALPSGYLGFIFKRILSVGTFGVIVEPMWFVIALFATLMIYAVLKKYLYKIWNSYIMLVLFCCLHIFVIYLAKNVDMEPIEYLLVPLKCLFFFPFLEMGIIYREHLEKKHIGLSGGSKLALMFILLVINVIRTCYLPSAYDVAFDSIDELAGFTSPYYVTPLVSSIVGILFWLTFTDLIEKAVSESRFVNFMSCNTFWIMGLHILFYNVLNCILMGISNCIAEIPYFDVEAFKGTEWYFWGISSNIKILYVLVGILGPLAVKWIYDRIYATVTGKIALIKCSSERTTKIVKALIKPACVLLMLLLAGAVLLIIKPGENKNGFGDGQGDIPGNENIIGAYAYLDIAYEYEDSGADYLADPCAIYDNGTYTIKISRHDNDETPLAFSGLSYMGIRLISDNSSLDNTEVLITDIKVTCDGTELKVIENGTVSLDDETKSNYFDCYDMNETNIFDDNIYDFTDKDTIEVTFTISGMK
ncbi:MAG: acyltransferase [Lachnospiraceae bacterium]|nr:acyltransferase [Lachnospiraceae bacterium]